MEMQTYVMLEKPDREQEMAILSDVEDLIGQAQEAFDNEEYSEALELFENARALLDEVEQGLKLQRQAEKGNGNGNGL